MSKTVIFAGSYPQIKNALYLATHSGSGGTVTIVIPGHNDLFKFFQAINEKVFHDTVNLIYFPYYLPRRASAKGLKKIPYVLPDIIEEKLYLKEIFDKYFAGLKGAEVFFSSRCFCPYTIYLLKKLSKGNRVTHISDPSMDGRKVESFTPANITDWARLMVMKLVYGRGITIGKFSYTDFPCMTDKLFERVVDKVIDVEERNEMMRGFDLSRYKVFDTGDYSVIYFDEGLLETSYLKIERDTFARELAEIFGIILKYFPEEKIARKYHPGYPGDKTVINVGDVLPDFVPAELLYNDNVKMYLSGFSLSIANVEKGLAVSFADLITLKDEEFKNQQREILTGRAKSKILFPQSLDEFEKILIEIKRTGGGS